MSRKWPEQELSLRIKALLGLKPYGTFISFDKGENVCIWVTIRYTMRQTSYTD